MRPLAAFGSWRRERPELDCGLKRGFTFFSHREGERWSRSAARENELLVAAYNVETTVQPLPYQLARWVDREPNDLRELRLPRTAPCSC